MMLFSVILVVTSHSARYFIKLFKHHKTTFFHELVQVNYFCYSTGEVVSVDVDYITRDEIFCFSSIERKKIIKKCQQINRQLSIFFFFFLLFNFLPFTSHELLIYFIDFMRMKAALLCCDINCFCNISANRQSSRA